MNLNACVKLNAELEFECKEAELKALNFKVIHIQVPDAVKKAGSKWELLYKRVVGVFCNDHASSNCLYGVERRPDNIKICIYLSCQVVDRYSNDQP